MANISVSTLLSLSSFHLSHSIINIASSHGHSWPKKILHFLYKGHTQTHTRTQPTQHASVCRCLFLPPPLPLSLSLLSLITFPYSINYNKLSTYTYTLRHSKNLRPPSLSSLSLPLSLLPSLSLLPALALTSSPRFWVRMPITGPGGVFAAVAADAAHTRSTARQRKRAMIAMMRVCNTSEEDKGK